MKKVIVFSLAILSGVFVFFIACYFAIYMWSTSYAEKITKKDNTSTLVGKDISEFRKSVRRKNWVRFERPYAVNSKVIIDQVFEPYSVFYYCPWPKMISFGPRLIVMVNANGKIGRFKKPLE